MYSVSITLGKKKFRYFELVELPKTSNRFYNIQLFHDQSLNVSSGFCNDFDLDGDALAVTSVGSPSHGNVSIGESGALLYTPARHAARDEAMGARAVSPAQR